MEAMSNKPNYIHNWKLTYAVGSTYIIKLNSRKKVMYKSLKPQHDTSTTTLKSYYVW